MSVADTCFLIDLLRQDPGAMSLADTVPDLKTTSISSAEFLYGARISVRPGRMDAAHAFLGHFRILPFDLESAILYADIAADLQAQGGRISSFDELIAAIALRYDEPLVTRDAHFSAIRGLTVLPY